MYIRRLRVENLYGFERLDLDFTHDDGGHAGWTVLAGPNGSGKTSALRAIAMLLRGPPGGRSRSDDAIRAGASNGSVSGDVIFAEEDHFATALPGASLDDLTWRFSRQSPLQPLSGRADDARRAAEQGTWNLRRGLGWFAVGYGPYRRLYGSEDIFTVYDSTTTEVLGLFAEGASIAEGVRRLVMLNHRRLHESTSEPERLHLAALESACLKLVGTLLFDAQIELTGVGPQGLIARRRGQEITMDRFSDGQRVLAALVVDVVMRIRESFGDRFHFDAATCVVAHSGVVLIDEVEGHLHPSWQRHVGPWFKRHFPNVQFIVTTHSPFICQAADRGGLIRLPGASECGRDAGKVSDETWREVANGSIDDAVVSELFGVSSTYSDEAEALRDEVAQLQVKARRGKATPDEHERLERLVEALPHNDDAAIDLARRRSEKLG